MRIVFVIPVGLQRPSGYRYANIAKELVANGHQVRILALHPDWAHCTLPRFVTDGVEVIYVGQMHSLKRGSHSAQFGLGQLLLTVAHSTVGLVRGILASPADIYHVGKPQPINGLAALVGICLLRGRRFYLDCDDDETNSNRLNRWQRSVFAFWERLTVQIAAGSTVNTRYLAARNRQAGHTHVVYVPNGVDLARFQLPAPDVVNGLRTALQLEDCPVVAYFGSLALQNHPVDLLLDAFVQVHRSRPETRLLVIGGGDDLALLQKMADGLGLGGVALFTGHVAQTALPELLALATVTVDPVHDNSVASARSPLKVFESLALGIPVVTADVGDRAELLQQGAAGVLVTPGDADALAHGILSVLGDEERRAAMSQAGRQHMRARYAWPRLAADWATLYAEGSDQPVHPPVNP